MTLARGRRTLPKLRRSPQYLQRLENLSRISGVDLRHQTFKLSWAISLTPPRHALFRASAENPARGPRSRTQIPDGASHPERRYYVGRR